MWQLSHFVYANALLAIDSDESIDALRRGLGVAGSVVGRAV